MPFSLSICKNADSKEVDLGRREFIPSKNVRPITKPNAARPQVVKPKLPSLTMVVKYNQSREKSSVGKDELTSYMESKLVGFRPFNGERGPNASERYIEGKHPYQNPTASPKSQSATKRQISISGATKKFKENSDFFWNGKETDNIELIDNDIDFTINQESTAIIETPVVHPYSQPNTSKIGILDDVDCFQQTYGMRVPETYLNSLKHLRTKTSFANAQQAAESNVDQLSRRDGHQTHSKSSLGWINFCCAV